MAPLWRSRFMLIIKYELIYHPRKILSTTKNGNDTINKKITCCCRDILGFPKKVMLSFFVDTLFSGSWKKWTVIRFTVILDSVTFVESCASTKQIQLSTASKKNGIGEGWRGYITKENKSNEKGDERFWKSQTIRDIQQIQQKWKHHPTNSMGLEHFGDFIDFFCSDVELYS